MLGKAARTAVGATIVGGLISAGVFVGTGVASATSTVTSDSCTKTTDGQIGNGLAISGDSIASIAYDAAKAQNRPLTVQPDKVKADAERISSIPLDTTIENAPSTAVSGSVIGTAVARAMSSTDHLGFSSPIGLFDQKSKTLSTIKSYVTAQCGLTADATNYVSPAQKQARQEKADQQAEQQRMATQSPSSSSTAGALSLGTTGRQAPRDYGNIPSAQPGQFAPSPAQKYGPGKGIPGYAPSFGKLPGTPGQPNAQDPVQNAGQAQALTGPQTPMNVGLPMLLAVLSIAGVTAALVRTWVLRRSSAA